MTDWTKVKLDVNRNLPLYLQISEKLRSMILSGDLKKANGSRLPVSFSESSTSARSPWKRESLHS